MVLKNRTAAVLSQQQPSTNVNALECANGDSCEFVVDSDKGNAYYKGHLLGKVFIYRSNSEMHFFTKITKRIRKKYFPRLCVI